MESCFITAHRHTKSHFSADQDQHLDGFGDFRQRARNTANRSRRFGITGNCFLSVAGFPDSAKCRQSGYFRKLLAAKLRVLATTWMQFGPLFTFCLATLRRKICAPCSTGKTAVAATIHLGTTFSSHAASLRISITRHPDIPTSAGTCPTICTR